MKIIYLINIIQRSPFVYIGEKFMKEYYEKFDHSKLQKFKEFLNENFELEEYNRDIINEAAILLLELHSLNEKALNESTKETDEIVKLLNNPLKSEEFKEAIRLNFDLDYVVHCDKEVCDTIKKLAYIATNRKIKI